MFGIDPVSLVPGRGTSDRRERYGAGDDPRKIERFRGAIGSPSSNPVVGVRQARVAQTQLSDHEIAALRGIHCVGLNRGRILGLPTIERPTERLLSETIIAKKEASFQRTGLS